MMCLKTGLVTAGVSTLHVAVLSQKPEPEAAAPGLPLVYVTLGQYSTLGFYLGRRRKIS